MEFAAMKVLFGSVVLSIALASILKSILQELARTKRHKDKAVQQASPIVGHEPAKPVVKVMAVKTIEPAFAEQTDWSEFDQPAYLRKKKKSSRKQRKPLKAEAPVVAEPANSEPAPAKQQKRLTPQQQMEEFRENAKRRRANKPSFEEI